MKCESEQKSMCLHSLDVVAVPPHVILSSSVRLCILVNYQLQGLDSNLLCFCCLFRNVEHRRHHVPHFV
jgi:hypothetical protein